MSAPLPARPVASAVPAEHMHLIRNLVILPVVLSAFECDKMYFEKNHNSGVMSPYAAVAQRAINRIRDDIDRLTDTLRQQGIEVYAEKRNQNGINRVFNFQGSRNVYALRWGAFDAEIDLLTNYYLGNLAEDEK